MEMWPMDVSRAIQAGGTTDWQSLERIKADLDIAPLKTTILVQKLNEIVALTWKLCF